MKVYKEIDLNVFEGWQGGKDTLRDLDDGQKEIVQQQLEELFPDGMSETTLNDFLWFERDTIAEWLGYADYDDFLSRDEEEEDY